MRNSALRGFATMLVVAALLSLDLTVASAQHPAPGEHRSSNVHVLTHLPLGRVFTIGGIEIEQDLARPFAYVARMQGTTNDAGFTVIDLANPDRARVIHGWTIEDSYAHRGVGGTEGKHFILDNQHYYVQGFQFSEGSPNSDLGAIVFDVTQLPEASEVREVGRIHASDTPGGFSNLFAYKHSDGRVLLVASTSGNHANIYDMAQMLEGRENHGLIGQISLPQVDYGGEGYQQVVVAYDPNTQQDKFYGAGAGGYHAYDITRPESPERLFSVTGIGGVTRGHAISVTPDGRFAMGQPEYRYEPLRIYDLGPGQEGETMNINRYIGTWTPSLRSLISRHEMRWPYLFVSAYEDGLQILNMRDPMEPRVVGFYNTYGGPHMRGWGGPEDPEGGRTVMNGAIGVNVRNADGLIVVSDMMTGFWAFRLDGFTRWQGHNVGMPDVSNAQDWRQGTRP